MVQSMTAGEDPRGCDVAPDHCIHEDDGRQLVCPACGVIRWGNPDVMKSIAQDLIDLSNDLHDALIDLREGKGDPLAEIERVANLLPHYAKGIEAGSEARRDRA